MMFELTADSTAQYKDLGVFTESGGIEVARTSTRMIELRRRCTQAKAWGIPAELITPGEVKVLEAQVIQVAREILDPRNRCGINHTRGQRVERYEGRRGAAVSHRSGNRRGALL